jgi:signal transduction histidine kinase
MPKPRPVDPHEEETVSVVTPQSSNLIDSGMLPVLRVPEDVHESTTNFVSRMRPRVLVIAGAQLSETIAKLLKSQAVSDFDVTVVHDPPQVMTHLREHAWDAFLMDEDSISVLSWLSEAERPRVLRRTVVITQLGCANPAILTCSAQLPVSRLNRFSLDNALVQVIRHQAPRPSEAPVRESLFDVFLRLSRLDLGQPRDMSEALRPLVESASSTLRCGRVSVWLFVDQPKRLRCLAMYDAASQQVMSGVEVPASACPVYCVSLHNHRIMAVEDAQRDSRTSELADIYLIENRIGALLDAPIYLDGQVVGLFCCAHIGGTRSWTMDEQQAAASFADYAQIVLTAHKRRLAEESAKVNAAELAQAREVEGLARLAGGIAHDFNNHLTVIQGRAEVIKRALGGLRSQSAAATGQMSAAAALEREVAPILLACEKAASMVAQLASFSRREERPKTEVDVAAVINSVCDLLERTIDRRVTIHRDLRVVGVKISGDPTGLHRALLNLGVNARDAMPEGGTLTFSLDVSGSPEVAEIRVTDTGVGIKDEHRDRIREPYYTTKVNGTGQGLAIVDAFVLEHGGELDFSSKVGVGTTFRIRIPSCMSAPTTSVTRKRAVVPGSASIILVEPDSAVRETTSHLLSFLGYTVFDCASPYTALKYFTDNRQDVHLVLIDLTAKEMTGRDCLRAFRLALKDVKCVMMGSEVESNGTDYLALGASAVIKKPFSMSALVETIEKSLRASAKSAPAPA